MKKIFVLLLLFGVTCGVTAVRASEAGENVPAEQPGKWKKAGKELGEAGHAVGEATAETSKKVWETTKEESVKAWDITKEKSKELWEKGKAKVHETTSPEPADESTAAEGEAMGEGEASSAGEMKAEIEDEKE